MLIVCVGAIFVCFAMVAICYRWSSSRLTLVYAATKTTKNSFDWKRRDFSLAGASPCFYFAALCHELTCFLFRFPIWIARSIGVALTRWLEGILTLYSRHRLATDSFYQLRNWSGTNLGLSWAVQNRLLKTSKYENWASPSLWWNQL